MRKSTPWDWGCRMVGLQPNEPAFRWQTNARRSAAPIVCPEESNMQAALKTNFTVRAFPPGD